jgi:hypothetical protein
VNYQLFGKIFHDTDITGTNNAWQCNRDCKYFATEVTDVKLPQQIDGSFAKIRRKQIVQQFDVCSIYMMAL